MWFAFIKHSIKLLVNLIKKKNETTHERAINKQKVEKIEKFSTERNWILLCTTSSLLDSVRYCGILNQRSKPFLVLYRATKSKLTEHCPFWFVFIGWCPTSQSRFKRPHSFGLELADLKRARAVGTRLSSITRASTDMRARHQSCVSRDFVRFPRLALVKHGNLCSHGSDSVKRFLFHQHANNYVNKVLAHFFHSFFFCFCFIIWILKTKRLWI